MPYSKKVCFVRQITQGVNQSWNYLGASLLNILIDSFPYYIIALFRFAAQVIIGLLSQLVMQTQFTLFSLNIWLCF